MHPPTSGISAAQSNPEPLWLGLEAAQVQPLFGQPSFVQFRSLVCSKYHLVPHENLHLEPVSTFWIPNPKRKEVSSFLSTSLLAASTPPVPDRGLGLEIPWGHLSAWSHGASFPTFAGFLLAGKKQRTSHYQMSQLPAGESPFVIVSMLPVHIFPVRCFHSVCSRRRGCTDGQQWYSCS